MINRSDLAKKLAKRTFLNQKESMMVIEELFQIVIEETFKEEEILITGFGKFYLYRQKPRPVRNPKTQEEMILKEYPTLRFKASDLVKKNLKSKK